MTIGRLATIVHVLSILTGAVLLLGAAGFLLALSYVSWRVMENNE